jgi:hypothetical protein
VRAGRVRGLDSRPLAVVVTGGNIDVHVLARLLTASA